MNNHEHATVPGKIATPQLPCVVLSLCNDYHQWIPIWMDNPQHIPTAASGCHESHQLLACHVWRLTETSAFPLPLQPLHIRIAWPLRQSKPLDFSAGIPISFYHRSILFPSSSPFPSQHQPFNICLYLSMNLPQQPQQPSLPPGGLTKGVARGTEPSSLELRLGKAEALGARDNRRTPGGRWWWSLVGGILGARTWRLWRMGSWLGHTAGSGN